MSRDQIDDSPAAWAVRRRRRMIALALAVLVGAAAGPAALHWAVLRIHATESGDAR